MPLDFEHYASDMLTVIEADETICYQGPAVERILGYRPEEHAGRNVREFLHPEDAARGEAALAEVIGRPGVSPPVEFRWRHADGGWRWLESIGNNLLSDPEVGAIVSSSRDVTDRKREEARYRTLVENMSAGFIVEDEDGRIVRANRLFCEMFGLSEGPEALAGRARAEVFRRAGALAADPERFAARSAELSARAEPAAGEEISLADGGCFEMDYVPVSVRGERRGCMWIYRDITVRKSAEREVHRERNLLRTVVDSARDPIFVKDLEHRFLLNNEPHLRALGLESQSQALGKTNADLWGERAARFHEDDLRVTRDGEVLYGREEEIRISPGERRWFSTTKVPLIGTGGRIEGLVGISRDIHDRRMAEEALRESEERYRTVVENAAEGIFLFDPDTGGILDSNAALGELLGYSGEELLGMSVYEIIAHEPREIDESVRLDFLHGRRFAGERRFRRSDGSRIDVEVGMAVVPYRGRSVLCSVVHDLTRRKRLEEELRHRATHDPLTALPNRAMFNDRLANTLEYGAPLAVLFIDLDGFKAVNDRYGHDVGDRLLTAVASRIRRCVRSEDTVCRLGGDEFLVLLEDAGTAEAGRESERILKALKRPLELTREEAGGAPERDAERDGPSVRIGASVGVAVSESPEAGLPESAALRAEALIREADEAMYRAKRSSSGWRS